MGLNTLSSKALKTVVDKIVALLQRDVRSFFPGWKQPEEAKPRPSETDGQPPSIHPMLDPTRVEYLAFRREVLNWRDEFHSRITQTAVELCNSFSLKIRQDLENESIFDRMRPRPACGILQDHFIRIVRVPMFSAVQQEQSELTELVKRWLPDATLDLAFPAPWAHSECDCLGNLSFTRKNQDEILTKIEALILGDNGVVDSYRNWATSLARNIIEERLL